MRAYLARGASHRELHVGVAKQNVQPPAEAERIAGRADEPGRAGQNVFRRPARIRDENRQSACLRFEDDVARRVRRARKDEYVGGGHGLRHGVVRQCSGEDRVGAETLELLAHRSVADEDETMRDVMADERRLEVVEEREALLARQPPRIQERRAPVADAPSVANGIGTAIRCERRRIDAAVPDPEPCAVETARRQQAQRRLGRPEQRPARPIHPVHVALRRPPEQRRTAQMRRIFGEVRVKAAHHRQPELRRHVQAGEPDRPGRRDVHDRDVIGAHTTSEGSQPRQIHPHLAIERECPCRSDLNAR